MAKLIKDGAFVANDAWTRIEDTGVTRQTGFVSEQRPDC